MSLNVVQFPGGNLQDIPGMARTFASDLEAGEYGDVRSVFVLVEKEDSIVGLQWGGSYDPLRTAGLYQLAISSIVTEY